ncbi:PREDICTED: blood group Rh(CE) polypeptide isoform X1 [Miniopterus natalensis]|uniref:blood group Rh(CE) polypeptide isoform X1 n=1 Tax=Miniopterus natalensis TaxID=291302 RepID=UPI0007A6E547|nr:PREDICTED: blood group Rh(CE) polypeptide isoform X1 [Miniopterus natalensis]
MSSKYPRSVRGCLPLWTLTLEGALIVAFFFFTEYDISPNNHKTMVILGAVLQDLTVMAALGLGFLPSALWRFGWSSVAFALLMLALGVQWAVLLDGFPKLLSSEKVVITLPSIQKATMSAMSVLISAGAILGKTNLVQLVVMVLMEVAAFVAMRVISHLFLFDDHVSMMHVHVFAAYFGLMVARCLSRRMPKAAEEKNRRTTSPSLFAMLGTLFLWMFWPSFNSALIFMPLERKTAVFNTYYALAVSTVTAISVSALVHPQGKINMNHVHNAVLAGGVAVGASCHIIASPWIAMVLGLLAGLIVGGAKCLQGHARGAPHHWGTQLGRGDGPSIWSPDSFLIWLLDFKQKHPRKTRLVPKQESFLSLLPTFLCVRQTLVITVSLCTMKQDRFDIKNKRLETCLSGNFVTILNKRSVSLKMMLPIFSWVQAHH